MIPGEKEIGVDHTGGVKSLRYSHMAISTYGSNAKSSLFALSVFLIYIQYLNDQGREVTTAGKNQPLKTKRGCYLILQSSIRQNSCIVTSNESNAELSRHKKAVSDNSLSYLYISSDF
jgi:hypothetical protein